MLGFFCREALQRANFKTGNAQLCTVGSNLKVQIRSSASQAEEPSSHEDGDPAATAFESMKK